MMNYFFTLFILFGFVGTAQQTDAVDFINGNIDITIDPSQKRVRGSVAYQFNVLKATDSIFIDAQQLEFGEVLINGKKGQFHNDGKKLWLLSTFSPNTSYTATLHYTAYPKKAMYFIGWEEKRDNTAKKQVWTQGQGKYSSNWLPSFDDVNEKVTFDLTIKFQEGYEVISNGKLLSQNTKEGVTTWEYDMKHPMSSYLLAIAIGKYVKKTSFAEGKTTLEYYYYPEDEASFESTYRYSKRLFDFLEKEIGVPYPWQNYKQIPVRDFLYAGMENTGTTLFSDAFVVDAIAYADRNYSNVNAHELAHQWFGNLVTAKEGTHHWLQEGFATYYALLAEREILGDDYFYYKLYENAEQLDALSKSDKGTALLDPKASSLTFYQHGAWALHALRNKIGDDHFKVTVQNYLKKYQFKTVTTTDFIREAEQVSGQDLSTFQSLWLTGVNFPSKHALKLLEKSSFIKRYLNLAKERTQPLIGKKTLLDEALQFPVNDYVGQEAVYQLAEYTSNDAIALYQKAFETNNLFVRQGIATTLSKIPAKLKTAYETLLEDKSYATIEAALYHLWTNFPQDRKAYLEKTKIITGFNDKNIRTLWLVLSISTSDYEMTNKKAFFEELASYTAPSFRTKVRENAFTYLQSLQTFSDQSLIHLMEGAVHYNWRFRNKCREILDTVLKDEAYRKKCVVLAKDLPQQQKDYLDKKLSEK